MESFRVFQVEDRRYEGNWTGNNFIGICIKGVPQDKHFEILYGSFNSNLQLHGFGVKKVFSNSTLSRYEGQFIKGKLHGYVVQRDGKTVIMSECYEDVWRGKLSITRETEKVTGTIDNHKGYMVIRENDKMVYVGQHTDWLKDGLGEFKISDNLYFRGLFIKDTPTYGLYYETNHNSWGKTTNQEITENDLNKFNLALTKIEYGAKVEGECNALLGPITSSSMRFCCPIERKASERAAKAVELHKMKNSRVDKGEDLSPICVISKVQIQKPAKGCRCEHLQCFDYNSWVQSNSYLCPICNIWIFGEKDLQEDDQFFQNVEEHINMINSKKEDFVLDLNETLDLNANLEEPDDMDTSTSFAQKQVLLRLKGDTMYRVVSISDFQSLIKMITDNFKENEEIDVIYCTESNIIIESDEDIQLLEPSTKIEYRSKMKLPPAPKEPEKIQLTNPLLSIPISSIPDEILVKMDPATLKEATRRNYDDLKRKVATLFDSMTRLHPYKNDSAVSTPTTTPAATPSKQTPLPVPTPPAPIPVTSPPPTPIPTTAPTPLPKQITVPPTSPAPAPAIPLPTPTPDPTITSTSKIEYAISPPPPETSKRLKRKLSEPSPSKAIKPANDIPTSPPPPMAVSPSPKSSIRDIETVPYSPPTPQHTPQPTPPTLSTKSKVNIREKTTTPPASSPPKPKEVVNKRKDSTEKGAIGRRKRKESTDNEVAQVPQGKRKTSKKSKSQVELEGERVAIWNTQLNVYVDVQTKSKQEKEICLLKKDEFPKASSIFYLQPYRNESIDMRNEQSGRLLANSDNVIILTTTGETTFTLEWGEDGYYLVSQGGYWYNAAEEPYLRVTPDKTQAHKFLFKKILRKGSTIIPNGNFKISF
eukprot:TRINITY_DN18289_c0_g1_i2.p1 TRINITY_DN18289_c0_g1~~TRINITY_DN18289_c0_g1_i2.p1  ORF type:complete len:873 (+),score=239.72 TRINITY_DN18289_c0_g1_i2:25-2643(+)